MLEGESLARFTHVRFWNVLVVLWLTYASYSLVRRPMSVARAEIETELGLSAAALSWVDTAFLVTTSCSQLLYGTLRKRLGASTILLVGFGSSVAAAAIFTFSYHIAMFVVVWGINGLAQGTGWAACLEIIGKWVLSAERGRIMGVWSTNMAVGGILGNVIPAYLIGRGLTWRSATLLAVTVGPCTVFFTAVAALRSNPNIVGLPTAAQILHGVTAEQLAEAPKLGFTRSGDCVVGGPSAESVGLNARDPYDEPSPPARPAEQQSRQRPGSVLTVLRLPGAVGYCLSYFLHKLVRYAFMFWLPYYLNKELHASSEMAGYIASAFDVGGVVGIVVSGYLSDCCFGGRRRILMLTFFTIGMAVVTFALGALSSQFADAMSLCTALVFLVGLFSFAMDALQTGSCMLGYCDATGAPVGAVSGVIGGVGSLGSAAQGVFTVLLSSSSWGTLFISFSVATVLGAALMARPLLMEMAAAKQQSD